MNKQAAVLVSGALAIASAMPAQAGTTSTTTTDDEVALVSLYAPSSSSTTFTTEAASEQLAAPSREFYSDLLDYVQAQVAYQGVVYDTFKTMGASQAALDALATAQGQVTNTSLKLVTYLQNVLSAA